MNKLSHSLIVAILIISSISCKKKTNDTSEIINPLKFIHPTNAIVIDNSKPMVLSWTKTNSTYYHLTIINTLNDSIELNQDNIQGQEFKLPHDLHYFLNDTTIPYLGVINDYMETDTIHFDVHYSKVENTLNTTYRLLYVAGSTTKSYIEFDDAFTCIFSRNYYFDTLNSQLILNLGVSSDHLYYSIVDASSNNSIIYSENVKFDKRKLINNQFLEYYYQGQYSIKNVLRINLFTKKIEIIPFTSQSLVSQGGFLHLVYYLGKG